MKSPIVIKITAPHDARGWIGFGCFVLTVMVLMMIWTDREMLKVDAFLIIATAIIITGWNGGPVGWAFQATKSGGEAAESSARIAEQAATAALPSIGKPTEVKVINPPDDPANVTEAKGN
jgi:hypothetical protein